MPTVPYTFPQPLNIPTGTGLSASGNSNPVSTVQRTADMALTFHIKFTLGGLTNATFTLQALNPDGATWGAVLTGAGATVGTGVLVASGNFALTVASPGAKQMRIAYVTTGVTASSGVVIDCTSRQ